MDPNQKYNFLPNFPVPNQSQNAQNLQRPIHLQNLGMPNNFQNPYMMPSNFGMQYPYNYSYMQFGQQPGVNNVVDQSTPKSNSIEIPEVCSKISEVNSAKTGRSYAVWSSEQNKLLLSGYFHFSNDSELGAGQTGNTFWGKVSSYVNEHSPNGPHRTREKCKSHYTLMNQKMSVWVGVFRRVLAENRSGWSDDDYINRAHELYVEDTKKKFTLLDEWKMVRNEPKYSPGCDVVSSRGSKRTSSEANNVPASIPNLIRPEGRDRAKKKAKCGSKSKAKVNFEVEYAKIESERQQYKESKEREMQLMEEVAKAQNEAARAKKMEMWLKLNERNQSNELDDFEEELLKMLRVELFGH